MTDTSESFPSPKSPVSSSNNKLSTGHDQAVAMDNMYRFTRHIYDLTRRYYLLGRDQLLEELVTGPGYSDSRSRMRNRSQFDQTRETYNNGCTLRAGCIPRNA